MLRPANILVLTGFATLAAASAARADDFSDCMQWTTRYQAGLPELQAGRTECRALEQSIRNDPKMKRNSEAMEIALQSMKCPRQQRACSRIAPERTVISCDKFLKSRPDDRARIAQATQFRAAAKSLYDECTAQ
jgi:hypothetical protein